jgi:hypothetical protein
MKMDSHAAGKNKIVVIWITTEDNDIIIECGEDFLEDLVFNISIKDKGSS